jgi:hypothetical protein
MNTLQVEVGRWVRDQITGKEGLVVHYNPFTEFFTIEQETGETWVDQGDYLIVIS